MRIMKLVTVLMLAGCTANITPNEGTNEYAEKWGCGNYSDGCFINCPIRLSADHQLGIGTIGFFDIVEHTSFGIDGLEKRWNWCLDNNETYRCSFTIDVEGNGKYYKFLNDENTAKPTEIYQCRKF